MPSDGPLFPQNYRDREVFLSGWQSYIYEVVKADGGRKRLRAWIVLREAEGIKASKRGSELLFENIELT